MADEITQAERDMMSREANEERPLPWRYRADVPRLLAALAAAEKREEQAGRLLGEQANHILAQCSAIAHLEAERDEFERCLLEIDHLVDPEHEHETWIAPVRALLARAEETQAAIEAEARAGQAACDLARLQPLIDAAVAYERAHSIAASAAPVLRAAAGEAVADARDALGHAALEVAEVLRG